MQVAVIGNSLTPAIARALQREKYKAAHSPIHLYRITRTDGWLNGAPAKETPHAERCGHFIRASSLVEAIAKFHKRFPGAEIEITLHTVNVGELKFPGGK